MVNNACRYGQPPIHIEIGIDDDLQPTEQVVTDETLTAEITSRQKHLTIKVSDEGQGVAEDQLERIMQPFERGETARTTQGSGLGLAIVSRITHLHNGSVIARNQPNGGGLVVVVNIPIID